MVVELSDDSSLERTRLTSICTNITNLRIVDDSFVSFIDCVSICILCKWLSVDEYEWDVSCNDLVDESICT